VKVGAMSDETNWITVIGIRANGYSPDGKNINISLTTKYSAAERRYSVPIECFRDLVLDLQRLNTGASGAPTETVVQPDIDSPQIASGQISPRWRLFRNGPSATATKPHKDKVSKIFGSKTD
jgi:hypothetical protein